ncbi:MAG: RNA methyltransferase [Eubacterium sp.]|nr:RNA methyltransferase [Eubacterium sp.]
MKIIEINDFLDKELDIYVRLSEKQLINGIGGSDPERPMENIFIAESPKVIDRALNAGYEAVSFLVEDSMIQGETKEVIEKAERLSGNNDIKVFSAPTNVLVKMAGFKLTRGVLSAMKRKESKDPKELIKDKRRIAVLESVVNPTNVGAIIRSAAALGVEAVLLTPDSADPLYRRALRVGMGTAFQVPWTYLDSCDDYIKDLHNLGFKTVAMALRENTVDIDDEELKKIGKMAILLGTEGEGLRESTIEQSDYTVKIPMANGVDSLNVAACSALCFFELTK